jgi:hypothetical protein
MPEESPEILAAALSLAAADVPEVLAPAGSIGRIAAAARRLESRFSAAFLECRLDRRDARVDFLACTTRTGPVLHSPPEGFGNVGAARGFASTLLKAWDTPGSGLHDLSPMVWLEHDDAGSHEELPEPSVCVCMERDYLRRRQFGRRRPEDWAEVIRTVLSLPGCPAEASRSFESLSSILGEIPENGRPIHLSIMCSREPARAKLYARVPTTELRAFLERIGWAGNWKPIEAFLAGASWAAPVSFLDLSIAESGPRPDLGLAFPSRAPGETFDRRMFRHAAGATEQAAQAALVEDALRDWERGRRLLPKDGNWPLVVHRWIDQKIVFPEAERPQLKVYLGLQPLLLLFGAAQAQG